MRDPEIRCFIDSDNWLYTFVEGGCGQIDPSPVYRGSKDATVSTQVIGEVCVNLVKK